LARDGKLRGLGPEENRFRWGRAERGEALPRRLRERISWGACLGCIEVGEGGKSVGGDTIEENSLIGGGGRWKVFDPAYGSRKGVYLGAYGQRGRIRGRGLKKGGP